MTIASNASSTAPIPNPSPTTSQTYEVHTFQTTSSKKPGGTNKNKGKSKKSFAGQGGEQAEQPPAKGSRNKNKVKYPCMICKEDHFMKDCPHLIRVHQYLEWGGSCSQPLVLTNPFPPQHQQMVTLNPRNLLWHSPQGGSLSNANIMMLN